MVTFTIDPVQLEATQRVVNDNYSEMRLRRIVDLTVRPYLTAEATEMLTARGERVPLDAVYPVLGRATSAAAVKAELLPVVAMLLSSRANFASWLSLLPDAEQVLWHMMLDRFYVSEDDASALTNVKLRPRHWSTRFDYSDDPFPWFERMECLLPDIGSITYLRLTRPLQLIPAGPDPLAGQEPVAPAVVASTEADTLRVVASLWNYFETGAVGVDKRNPLSPAVIAAVARTGATPLPASDVKARTPVRNHLLAYAVSTVFGSVPDQCEQAITGAQRVRLMCQMAMMCHESLFTIATQHIKGLRAADREQGYLTDVYNGLRTVLADHPDRWLTPGQIEQCLRNMPQIPVNALAGAVPRTAASRNLTIAATGVPVMPDDMMACVGRPALRCLLYLLASIGVLDYTTDPVEPARKHLSPFDAITAVRLNALGRYALGVDDTYDAPEVEIEREFVVMDGRLIVHAMNPNSPFMEQLAAVATEVGNNRWAVTPQSFLKKCRTHDDLERAVLRFKKLIGVELSPLWLSFFDGLKRRIKPFSFESVSGYRLLRVAPGNTDLIGLLDTDERLRSMVIRAEGYRLLVDNNHYSAFIARLRTLGYVQP